MSEQAVDGLLALVENQRAEIVRLRSETDRLKREWERECADGDAVLQALGIDAQDYRTDGGSLNLPKIRVHIHALLERKP